VERLIAWYRIGSSVGAVVALLVANAIPLIGVLWFGWNVWTILIVYWLENGIVGAFNILKILKAEGEPGPVAGTMTMNGRPIGQGAAAKASLIPFFVVHYGLFWAVHGIFVLTLPVFAGIGSDVSRVTSDPAIGPLPSGLVVDPGLLESLPGGDPEASLMRGVSPSTIIVAVIALTISHGASFYLNFLKGGEYRRVSPQGQMFAPYGRLVVLHLTIIFGGIAISFLGAPQAAIAVLVALKAALDLGFHLTEHRKAATRATSRTVATT
jgi:Family of unknown function (DUF6498)